MLRVCAAALAGMLALAGLSLLTLGFMRRRV